MITIETADTVSVSLPKGQSSVDVNVAKLPASSLSHIFAYGLRQILNDAMASGDKSKPAECLALAQKRLDNLIAGNLRASPSRESDPIKARAIVLASSIIRAKPAFLAWMAKSSLKQSDNEVAKKVRELADAAIAKEGNPFLAQAKIDVEAAKALDIEIEI